MTYLPPKHWWLYLIRFTAKCQKLSVTEQYDAGVRWFDFRITFKKGKDGLYHNPTFAHGLIDYKSPDLLNILDWLNNQLDGDLWPWIYAKFHNKKHINQYKDQDVFLVIDFIKKNGRY